MNKKIKIAFAIDRMSVGGAPAVVFQQMKSLNKDLFEPHLITLYPSKKGNFLKHLDFIGKDHVHLFSLKDRSLFDVGTWYKIFRLLRKEKFDVAYTHLFLANTIVRFAAFLAGVRVIFSFEHSRYTDKRVWQKSVDKLWSFFTTKIIVSTEEVAAFTSKQEAISRSKFFVLPNAITVPHLAEEQKKDLKKKFSIPEEALVVLTIGRFSEEKGHAYLLQASKRIVETFPRVHILLVGHGALRHDLEGRIMEKKYPVQLIEEPERAKEFYSIADIFVLPSTREGQSMVIYEAMQAGVPVVATNLPTIREGITDGVNGLLVSPRKPEDITEKVITLLENPHKRDALVKEGRKRVRGMDPQENILQLERLIQHYV